MASLSQVEENYVRMHLLLTGICPRAARIFFDQEFSPECLAASLNKEHNKLWDLKEKHIINQTQYDLLIPRKPEVPNSRTFDINLIITLIRHLTEIKPPLCGFDCLPTALETTQVADLARIKFYRNYLAHLGDGKVESIYFDSAWDNLSEAIGRLGGLSMKQECDQLRTKPLDQTNQEFRMDIKRFYKEIKELNDSFVSLKQSHVLLQDDNHKIKRTHEELQEKHAEIITEVQRLKISQDDTVPWNIRAIMKETLKAWKKHDETFFIKTKAAEEVLKLIKEHSCVTITASFGAGKTSILRHVALRMEEENTDILLVTDPSEIVRFHNPNKKTLFVIDDLCGNLSVDQSDIKSWEPIIDVIKQIIENKYIQILTACRLQVFNDKKFESLSFFKSSVCYLISNNKHDIRMPKTEKQAIAKLYMETETSDPAVLYNIYDCFPLLCKLYHDNPKLKANDFFKNPFSVYKSEIEKLHKNGQNAKCCALALCVMFNNRLQDEIFTEDVNEGISKSIEKLCEACRLDRGTSRLVLQDELDSLQGTFIKKTRNIYTFIDDNIFDFLAYFYGQKLVHCFITNADSDLIETKFLLERKADIDQFITIIPPKYHQLYIQRMIDDLSKGKVKNVFRNINMKVPQFRQDFLLHLNTLETSFQKQLARTCEFSTNAHLCYDDGNKTVLARCCIIGDISFVKWCLNLGVKVNTCEYIHLSPVMKACEQGHTEVVKILLDRGADHNKDGFRGLSLLVKSSEKGHLHIVKMLLDRGADYNKWDFAHECAVNSACKNGHTDIVKMLIDSDESFYEYEGWFKSPLMVACKYGRTAIVKLLLDRGEDDFTTYDRKGKSPLTMSCIQPHTEIVKILLDRGADYNLCDKIGNTPLSVACESNNEELVQMLLDRGAEYDSYDKYNRSPLTICCKFGYTKIVKMLIDRGADFNKCDRLGQTPLMESCKHGNTDIVKMLLDRETEVNQSDSKDESPLMKACESGHTGIVKMLIDKGVNYNECDNYMRSSFRKACEKGHIGTVQVLLDYRVDYNKCDIYEQSPFLIACKEGRTEIVQVLIDREVDINKWNRDHKTPLSMACQYGHVAIVKLLLDRGVDCNKCDISNRSPFMMACKYADKEHKIICEFVGPDAHLQVSLDGLTTLVGIPEFVNVERIMKACEYVHVNIFKILTMLLAKGADCNLCDNCGRSPIMNGCESGHTKIVTFLLERGADFSKCDYNGQSPLMVACKYGHTYIVKMLLDKGADYNERDIFKMSPTTKTYHNSLTEIVKILLEKEVDCSTCDIWGRSPLFKACYRGHKEIVKLLLEKEADCCYT